MTTEILKYALEIGIKTIGEFGKHKSQLKLSFLAKKARKAIQ